jgi:uncharacterized protein (DUF2147 family)
MDPRLSGRTLPFFAGASLIVAVLAMPANAAGFMGEWARGDGVAQARMTQCGDRLCMTNTRIQNSTEGEKVGDKVIITVKQRSDDKISGVAFDPQRDRSYNIDIKLDGDRMTMSGCIAAGLICKSMQWTRLH